jgi:very-short-patch-repair endonuclease
VILISKTDVTTTVPEPPSTAALDSLAQTTINSRERTDRDRYLTRLGYTILHLEAAAVEQQLQVAVEAVQATLLAARVG